MGALSARRLLMTLVVDTHAVIWYLFDDARLSLRAKEAIEQVASDGGHVALSSISLIEIVYLTEKRRIPAATMPRLLSVLYREDALLHEVPVDSRIAQAMTEIERDVIPDMPDRIIAATALTLGVPLVSRDGKIRQSNLVTLW